jgi:hypothetical protein
MQVRRDPIIAERVRTIPRSFSWIDRDLLHHGHLAALSSNEILLYFFLVLVAGPEGTSYWSYGRIAKLLKISEADVLDALRGLIDKDLVAFEFPRFQVLSLPEKKLGGRP